MTQTLSTQALEELLGLSPNMLTVVDESGVIKYKNSTIKDRLGYTPESLTGENVFDYIHPDDRQTVAETFYELVDTPKGYITDSVEFRFQHADGSWVWLETQLSNKKGTDIGGYVASSRDITERKRRQQELTAANRKLTALVENTDEAIYIKDREGTYLFMNKAAATLFDLTPEEVVGKDDEALFDPDSVAAIRAVDRKILDTGEAHTKEAIRWIDGDRHVFLDNKYPYRDDDGDIIGIMGISRDITDRKRREETLATLHEATRGLMEATTTEEVATVASETATEVLDLQINAITRYDPTQEALVPVAWSERTEAVIGQPPPSIPVEESLAGNAYTTNTPEIYADVREADNVLNPETPVRSALHLPLGDYGVLIAGSTTVGDFDSSDETLGQLFAANVEAAFDRVEREQALKERNERLDEFAGIVSHDLRNPLTVIGGHLQLVRENHDSEHLDAIADAHDRMDALVEDLLTLARHGDDVGEVTPVHMGRLLEACWGTVETGDAELRVETDATVWADESRLKELVENLFRNAIEHGGEDVTITVGDLPGSEGFYIEDNGEGIPEADRETVFDSGFSTRPEGTGFGLTIVKRIAEAHDWTVTLAEESEGGARFEFRGLDIEP